MTTKQKIFVAANLCVAGLVVTGVYFSFLTPAPPLCNKGRYSFISYISDVLLRHHRDRWIIYVCDYGQSCGELPLRLDGIMSTYILSVLSGRKIGILFAKPLPLQQLLQPVKIDWIVDPSTLVFASCNYYNYMFNEELSSKMKTFSLDWEFPEEVVYIKLNRFYWNSLYENSRYREKLRELGYTASGTYYQAFVKLFEPQPKFKQTVWKYSNQFKSHLSTNLICVMIANENGGKVKKQQILWQFLAQFEHSKDTRILLSSGNHDLANKTQKRFPRMLATISGSQRYIDGDSVETSTGETLSENLMNNILDFYTLIQCDQLVMECGSDWGRVVAFSRNTNQGLHYMQNGTVRNLDLDALSMDYEERICPDRTIKRNSTRDSRKEEI